MNFKMVFRIWLAIVGCAVFSLIVAAVVIDPIGAVGFPILKGVNNNKYAQASYMDVYKPYELARKEADVLFIGTSRVYRGIRPTLNGYQDEKVYNLGLSSLSLDHMREYLRFAYRVHQPKKLFIGLDLFNFSKTNYKTRKVGFSQERLDNINNFSNVYYVTKETLQLDKSVLKNTLIKSYRDKNTGSPFHNGWFIREDDAPEIVEEGYYFNLNSYIDSYKKFEYTDEAIECLQSIVQEAEGLGIETYVFFNPINADICNIIYSCGHGEELAKVKKVIVSRISKVYDFNFNNSYTDNRKLYYDCSHYSPKMGEYVKADIMGGQDTERMHILTADNIDRHLTEDYEGYQEWSSKNRVFVNLMNQKINNNSKLEVEEFKDIIGF